MIIPDINILIYALNRDSHNHGKAKRWLEEAFSGDKPVGLSWIVLLGFLRLVTSGKIMERPLPMETAFGVIDEWMALPSVVIIEPTERHWDIMKELLSPLSTAGNLTSDAHLAALAIQHGGVLCSTDHDFGRFKGLRWENPLV